MNPPHAARGSAPPTLTRRTPSWARAASPGPPEEPINTLTGFDHGPYLFHGAQARRIQAIGTRIRVGPQSGDGLCKIGSPDDEALGAPHEQRIGAARIDCFARGPESSHGGVEFEQGGVGAAGRVLDRQPR